MKRWLSPEQFAAEAGKSAVVDGGVRIGAVTEVVQGEDRRLTFTISTDSPDRDRDVIDVSGWDLSSYARNGVVTWAHDYSAPPVARAIRVWTEGGALKATAEFADADLYPFADMVYRMYQKGFLSAVSVGFRPLEWNFNDERRGIDFKRCELLEFACMPVPANAEALIEARAAGVDVAPLKAWAEKTLEWLGARAALPASSQQVVDIDALSARLVKDLRAAQEAAHQRPKGAEECPKAGQCGLLATDTGVCPAAGDCPMGRGQAAAQLADVKLLAPMAVLTLTEIDAYKAALTKRGRVLSGANERRLRDAAMSAEAASAKIAEVVAQVEAAPEADEVEVDAAPTPEMKTVPEDAIDLDAIVYERDELSDLTAEDILGALRDVIGAEVAAGARRVINGALGRVD